MSPLLEVDRLSVGYGGVIAVRDVSLSVEPGEVLALLGANGAGKTSTLRAVSGLVRARGGAIRIDGVDVTRHSTESIARLGVAHVPAGRGIFPTLSVADNLRMGSYGAGAQGGRRDRLDRVYATFPILAERRAQAAGTMSGGQQQQLAIGRALVQEPRLLLLDEMSMGLAPKVVADLFDVVRTLRADGLAIVMVEQFVGEALGVADRVCVLEHGSVVASGAPGELTADAVAAAYLGGHGAHASLVVPPPPASAREQMRVGLGGRQMRDLERLAARRGVPVEGLVAAAVERLLEEPRP